MSETSASNERDSADRLLADVLGEVSAALSGTLELDTVLDLILEQASRLVPYTDGTVLLVEGDHIEVVRARGYGGAMLGVQFPVNPLTGRIIETGQPVVVEDTTREPDWIVAEGGENIRSAAIVGIRSEGEVVGFISLDSAATGSFTLEQAETLQVLADLAGNAIRNARIFREADAARREAERAAARLEEAVAEMREQGRLTHVLGDISAELTVRRNLDDLLDFIIERVSGFVAGAAVSVLLIEDDAGEVVRSTEPQLVGTRLTISETPSLREAAGTQRPYLIGDTHTDAAAWVWSEDTPWIRSNLTAPIILGGEVIGFLTLSSGEPNAFPTAFFRPLETFSSQVGVAIQNARIIEESRTARSAEREERRLAEALSEVSAALNSTLELDHVLDLILERLSGVVPFSNGTILMFDGDAAEVVRVKGYDASVVGTRLTLPAVPNLQRLMTSGEPSLISDTRSDPSWAEPPPGVEHIRSAMTVAIRTDRGVVGAISVDSDKVAAFSVDQVKRLEAFADQAATAVRNARLYQESQAARRRSDQLLRAILPDQIATELTQTDRVRARRHEDVAVLFADIVGFTDYSDTHDPEEVLGALTEMTERFEEIADRHGLEQIKTSGDSFMAAAGLLSPVLNPDLQCVKAGLDLVEWASDPDSIWHVRVGVHSGDLVAGVIGTKRFLFDIWGDTVNTASRVESQGVPNGVSVSGVAWSKIAHACRGRSRGKVPVKGKGEMEMFLVEGLR